MSAVSCLHVGAACADMQGKPQMPIGASTFGRVIGITGGMGVGKTTFAEQAWLRLHHSDVRARTLLVDNLRYEFLCNSWLPHHVEARRALADRLAVEPEADGTFDFLTISDAVLRSSETEAAFREVACPALVEDARAFIAGCSDVILLEGALLLEEGFGQLLDSPLMLLSCGDEERARRLQTRHGNRLSARRISARLARQPSSAERLRLAAELGISVLRVDTTEATAARQASAELAFALGASRFPPEPHRTGMGAPSAGARDRKAQQAPS